MKNKIRITIYSIDYKDKRHDFDFDIKTGWTADRTFYERKIKKKIHSF